MSVAEQRQIRRDERAALLQRAITLLQGDERVVAAWLIGSEGRGEADELSDIDLWVVVADEHIDVVKAQRREIVARLGAPVLVLTVDAPPAAPPSGAYLLALYPGQAGALHVDWRWQPRSGATLPRQQARVLFDRVGLPTAAETGTRTRAERAATASAQVSGFWGQSAITVKAVVRGRSWAALERIAFMRSYLDEVNALVEDSPLMPGAPRSTTTPPIRADEQLALLRALCREMEALMRRVEELGGSVPWDAVPQIYRFFDLAEGFIRGE